MMQKFIITPPEHLPGRVKIQDQDARHIARTLRMETGSRLNLTDGDGTDYSGMIIEITKTTITVEIREAHPSSTESALHLTLCCAMLKDKNMDMVIRHVTQLGVHEWIPFYSERTVPKPDRKKASRKTDRWNEIARESLKQCRRSCLPRIHAPLPFDAMLEETAPAGHKLAFWENAAQPLTSLSSRPGTESAALLIGPEGGFSENEIQKAIAAGFTPCLIGPRILRAETAAIVCSALVQHLLGDM